MVRDQPASSLPGQATKPREWDPGSWEVLGGCLGLRKQRVVGVEGTDFEARPWLPIPGFLSFWLCSLGQDASPFVPPLYFSKRGC